MSRWSAFLRCHNYKRKLFTVPGRDVSTSAQFPATVNDWEGFMMTFARRNEIFWTFRRENLLHDGVIFESAKKKASDGKTERQIYFLSSRHRYTYPIYRNAGCEAKTNRVKCFDELSHYVKIECSYFNLISHNIKIQCNVILISCYVT